MHANLCASFGFVVPTSLVRLAEASSEIDLERAIGTMLAFGAEEWNGTRWHYHGPGYHTWQPEFFEILRPGVDGIGQGFVVHAPELACSDWPVYEHDPSGYNGQMVFLGAVLHEALEMLVANDACYSDRNQPLEANPDYIALAERLDLSRERKTLVRLHGIENCRQPFVPDGWRFEPCGDMIGALAPAETFMENQLLIADFRKLYLDDEVAARDAMMDAARDALERGFAGSALLGVRRLHRLDVTTSPFDVQPLYKLWASIYTALERPLLARNVLRRLEARF